MLKKKSLLAVVCIVFAVIAPVLHAAPLLEEDAYLEAMEAFNEKKYDEASGKFDEFLKNFPDSSYKPNILLKQAELADDFFEKKALYEKVILDYQNSEYEAEAAYSLGRAYYAREDYQSAEKYLTAMLKKHSNSFWVEPSYYYLMLTLISMEHYGEAENIYGDYNSNNQFYMYKSRMDLAYANMLMRKKNYSKAAKVYNEILSGYDEKERYIYAPDIYARLADCYEKTGESEKRERILKELKLKYPGSKESKQVKEQVRKNADAADAKTPEIKTQPVVKAPAKEKNEKFYSVQLGAFSTRANAEKMKNRYEDKGYSMIIRKSGSLYLVQLGRFDTYGQAKSFAEDFSV
ncbi:MAG: SPOR domain-containing protein, partial [bacterium]